MPRCNILWAVGFVVVVALVSGGCGGDDGGSNPYGQGSVTCVVDGAPVDLSFMTSGQYQPSGGMTGITGMGATQVITIIFPGNAPGTWTSPTGGAEVMYGDATENTYWADDTRGGPYVINVTAYGPVGGRIEGTFSATVTESGGPGTHTITGSFSVVRIPEQ